MSMEDVINHFIDQVEKLYEETSGGIDGFSKEFQVSFNDPQHDTMGKGRQDHALLNYFNLNCC